MSQDKVSLLRSILDRVQRKAKEPRSAGSLAVETTAVPAPTPAPPVAAVAPAAPAAPDAPLELVGAVITASSDRAPTTARPVPSSPAPAPAPEALEQLEELIEEPEEVSAPAPAAAVAAPPRQDEMLEESDLLEELGAPPPVEERAPISSRRPRALEAPASHDELVEVAEEEHEVPLKTPPPESGRQQVSPVAELQLAADDADAHGLEMEIPVAPEIRMPAPAQADRPSLEQIGATIELGSDEEPDLALELAPRAAPAARPSGEMEAVLPSASGAGTFDAELAPPPTAAADLARHDEAVGRTSAAPPRFEHTEPGPAIAVLPKPASVVPPRPPSAPPAAAIPEPMPEVAAPVVMPAVVQAPAAGAPQAEVRLVVEPPPAPAPVPVVTGAVAAVPVELAADITRRSAPIAADVAAFAGEAKRFAPATFGELLDASLGL